MIDTVLSLIALVILSPLLLITALAVKLSSPGPVLFKQQRLGLYGKVFTIYKFRSMTDGAEHTGSGVYSGNGDPRVTKVGKIIRATSIDELPQFINIIVGDMAIVGPRPPLTYHPWPVDQYSEEQFHMFDVRPGITGWAQVHGRKGVEWHERIKMNVWYTQHVSLALDIKILFMTVFKVLRNEDNVSIPARRSERDQMLKLMYITNDPAVAKIAADAGVDRIFIDMEVLGKAERQGGMDTVQSHHVPEDIAKVRAAIGDQAEIMARVNPLNPNSQTEIDDAIANGADVIMLPMWRTADDLRQLVSMVDGRAKVMPLLETDTAADNLPEALAILGIDQMHIGLNDLHLCYHQRFMFQLLTDGTVDRLCAELREASIPYGFGGVGRPGSGTLPAEYIIGEHYRLGSQYVILSRSFCNTEKTTDLDEIRRIFTEGVADIRRVERDCAAWTQEQFDENHRRVCACVENIVRGMNA